MNEGGSLAKVYLHSYVTLFSNALFFIFYGCYFLKPFAIFSNTWLCYVHFNYIVQVSKTLHFVIVSWNWYCVETRRSRKIKHKSDVFIPSNHLATLQYEDVSKYMGMLCMEGMFPGPRWTQLTSETRVRLGLFTS